MTRSSWRLPWFFLLVLGPACAGDGLPDAATCQATLSDASLPDTAEEATAARAAGQSWTDAQIRTIYICRALQIGPENALWVKAGADAQTRARRAWQIRHDARLTARAMMADPEAVKALQARDQERYGSPDGPSFDWLLKHDADKGLSGDAVYEAIVESAQRTDGEVNRSAGL